MARRLVVSLRSSIDVNQLTISDLFSPNEVGLYPAYAPTDRRTPSDTLEIVQFASSSAFPDSGHPAIPQQTHSASLTCCASRDLCGAVRTCSAFLAWADNVGLSVHSCSVSLDRGANPQLTRTIFATSSPNIAATSSARQLFAARDQLEATQVRVIVPIVVHVSSTVSCNTAAWSTRTSVIPVAVRKFATAIGWLMLQRQSSRREEVEQLTKVSDRDLSVVGRSVSSISKQPSTRVHCPVKPPYDLKSSAR